MTEQIAEAKGHARVRGPFQTKCPFCQGYYKGDREAHLAECRGFERRSRRMGHFDS